MAKQELGRALTRLGNVLLNISAKPGYVSAWLVPVLVLVAVISVTGAQFGLNVLLTWETPIPLFGQRLSMTGLAELQWHVLSLLIMLAGAYTLKEDRHIRVDIFSDRFSERTRKVIDIVGDLVLLIPFFALLLWFSLNSVQTAYQFAEQSNSGGLIDRYLVKAVLPLGCALLIVAGTGRVLRNVGQLLAPDPMDIQTVKEGA